MKNKLYSLRIYILTFVFGVLLIGIISANKSSPIISAFFSYKSPKDVDDSSFIMPLPKNELSINQVLENGKELLIQFTYNDPDWKRAAFKDYWTNARWSNVPVRIHYALHRVFSTYATASIYYDFIHDLGIAEESNKFIKYESDSPYDYLHVVVMNTLIEKIVTYENQIVIVGVPQRTGLQAIIIPVNEISPLENTDSILIQLVTPDGYELDYTTETLVSKH